MKRIYIAYKELIKSIYQGSPFIIFITLLASILEGLAIPFGIYINAKIFDGAILVAQGSLRFLDYSYILILRSSYKEKMLRKLKNLKYEHFEKQVSIEIMDKVYNRIENSMWLLFPLYINLMISCGIAAVGTIFLFARAAWWFLPALLLPFLLETYILHKRNWNIYKGWGEGFSCRM